MSINQTILEIDLNALAHNYQYLRDKLSENTKFMAVVKAFAYGSDQNKIAKKLENLGTDYFAVAYIKEGVALRKAGISKPILVFHPQPENSAQLTENNLMPCLYNKASLEAFVKFLNKNKIKNYPVHLEINTGMNRLGFSPNDINDLKQILTDRPELNIHGVYTHFAASDDADERKFTEKQIKLFKEAVKKLEPVIHEETILHCCNTSGILNYPEAHFDCVRGGIGLYGYGNAAEIDKQLNPVASLKTVISQIHHLATGESVGYNRAFKAEKPRLTATLPLGHADGISRIYGHGKSFVQINGKRAPIIGNVCMDMIMIDITDVNCKVGDEVLIFGKGKSAEEFAHSGGTISYELITSISQRVTRKIID